MSWTASAASNPAKPLFRDKHAALIQMRAHLGGSAFRVSDEPIAVR